MLTTTAESDEVIAFWFSNGDKYNEAWFDGSIDLEVRQGFGPLLARAEAGELDHWKEAPQSRLALIILYDQFTRNIYRGGDYRRNDSKAYPLAKWSILTTKDRQYPLVQRLFLLLPLRHARNTEDLDLVLEVLRDYEVEFTDSQSVAIINRFFRATLRDYSKVVDTIKVVDEFTGVYPRLDPVVLDEMCLSYPPDSRLDDKVSNSLYQMCSSFVERTGCSGVCVSLSGGVDSMVLLSLFNQLRLQKRISRLVAAHVDYGNREVSAAEASFVAEWCRYLGVTLYTRRISHIRRGEIERALYEDETRRIRFALYQHVLDKNPDVYGVCLGHHQGDLVENVLMNVFRGRDLLNLNKMQEESLQDGVLICRPLLPCSKDDIYKLAWRCHIPYMKDTTCESCVRGVLRNKILPRVGLVQDSFANILGTGRSSDAWAGIVDSMIVRPIVEKVVDSKLGFHVDLPKTLNHDIIWRKVHAEIFQQRGLRMISRHSNYNLTSREDRLYHLPNGCLALICSGRHYFIYTKYLTPVAPVTLTDVTNIRVGQWKITVTETNDFIKKVSRFDDLFTGVVYTLPNYGTFQVVAKVPRSSSARSRLRFGKVSRYIPKLVEVPRGELKGYVKVTITSD